MLKASLIQSGRYGFTCSNCKKDILFFDILPYFFDIVLEIQSNIQEKKEIKEKPKIENSLGSSSSIEAAKTKLRRPSKIISPSKNISSQCVRCRKFNDASCPGANINIGSYARASYFCGSFSPKYRTNKFDY
jgi:hypothetical protein